MKIYILMQHYEADFAYAYDVPTAAPVYAYKTEDTAAEEKKKFEKLNKADRCGEWQEGDCTCYYTIVETELIG